MENVTTEEEMDKLCIFYARFGKLDEQFWWYIYRIQTDTGAQFTSKEFQEGLSVRGVQLELAASDHQEMNGQVEVKWQTL